MISSLFTSVVVFIIQARMMWYNSVDKKVIVSIILKKAFLARFWYHILWLWSYSWVTCAFLVLPFFIAGLFLHGYSLSAWPEISKINSVYWCWYGHRSIMRTFHCMLVTVWDVYRRPYSIMFDQLLLDSINWKYLLVRKPCRCKDIYRQIIRCFLYLCVNI